METDLGTTGELRALVVDDNVDAATSLSYLLQLVGCKTAVAFGGAMGLRILQLFRPAVVFMDLNLASEDGCTVLQQARALEGTAPSTLFVCLSGASEPDAESRCLAAGFDRFVRKPMEAGVLAEILHEARVRIAQAGCVQSPAAVEPSDPAGTSQSGE